MSDSIQAALEAAVREIVAHDPKFVFNADACRTLPLGDWRNTVPGRQAVAAIAAFHQKMAAELRKAGREYWPQANVHADLAAAVERAAAKEENNNE